MVAYLPKRDDTYAVPVRRKKLSHELFHGLSPEEFDREAKSLADAEGMTPSVRSRIEAQLIERLKTPVDRPSWGPDWVRHGERVSAASQHKRDSAFATWMKPKEKASSDAADDDADERGFARDDDSDIIMRNMEKSRQVAHYRPLYIIAAGLAVVIALLAMFVDYHIIREVWTRALANEFMQVPAALQSSVIFKSLQVIFAVLIVHFFLRITGVYGRNAMIVAAFIVALMMVGALGYLNAYSNMAGGISATQETPRTDGASGSGGNSSIDALFSKPSDSAPAAAAITPASDGFSIGLPRLSATSLADADSWFWMAFATGIFFIVTTVAALYMLTVENNVRNLHLASDYKHRQRQFAQLHMLQLADKRTARVSAAPAAAAEAE
jgi:hypothetical protein